MLGVSFCHASRLMDEIKPILLDASTVLGYGVRMTCIVGLVHDKCVYVGGDSAGVSGDSIHVRADSKVFGKGPMIMGFTSSYRMGQLLRWNLKLPKHPRSMTTEEYMTTVFVDAVRKCLKTGGFSKVSDGVEEGGCFLVGYRNSLFQVHEDYQVAINTAPYAAVGCGRQVALGSLYSTSTAAHPRGRVLLALESAEAFCSGVRRPFLVLVNSIREIK